MANQQRREISARWYEKNKKSHLKSMRDKYKNNRLASLLNAARNRASSSGMEFNILEEDLSIPSHCPFLGIPISTEVTDKFNRSPNTLSIHRLDSTKGYVRFNVVVCSWRANKLIGDATAEEIELINKEYQRIKEQQCLDLERDQNKD